MFHTENENGTPFTDINTDSILSWLADSWDENDLEDLWMFRSRMRVLIARVLGPEARENFETMCEYQPEYGKARKWAAEWLLARKHRKTGDKEFDRPHLRRLLRKVWDKGTEKYLFDDHDFDPTS
jgi:hypothetical protein